MLAATGRMDEAIECFRTAARLDPRSAAARINLAAAYLDRGDWAAAAAAGREAVRLDPADPFGHCNLGLALTRLGDWDGAAAALREGLRLDPNLAPAREALQTVLRGKAERDARTAPPPREVRR